MDRRSATLRPKVFGIGLPRTGTTTLGRCLDLIGYRRLGFDLAALRAFATGAQRYLNVQLAMHDAFEDAPWFMAYEEMEGRYPDARFVLTLRKDAARWVESAVRHDERHANYPESQDARRLFMEHYRRTLGVTFTTPDEVYLRHNAAVREFFADKPGKLLTVCWETGDGWDALCAFLGHEPPAGVSFPHENAGGRTE